MIRITGKCAVRSIGGSFYIRLPPDAVKVVKDFQDIDEECEIVFDADAEELQIIVKV